MQAIEPDDRQIDRSTVSGSKSRSLPRIGACVLTAAMLIGVAACEPAYKRVDGNAIAAGMPEGEWLSYGRTYSEQRFSALDQINDETIGRLAPEWSMELPDGRSLVSTSLVVDGVLYFTTAWSIVLALDAVTGELRWNYDPKTIEVMARNPERLKISWGTNRGVAFWKGKVYVGTTDGRLIALFAKTGAPAWSVQTFNPKESRMLTGYPLAFNGKIIIGHGGADFGATRGFATAYDAETGRQVWRFYAVPGDPSKGFENKAMEMAAKTWTGEWWKFGGGGTIWNSMTYDPELNRVYLGTGNGQPWNRKVRSPGGGDNLFLCSVGRHAWGRYRTSWSSFQICRSSVTVLREAAHDTNSEVILERARSRPANKDTISAINVVFTVYLISRYSPLFELLSFLTLPAMGANPENIALAHPRLSPAVLGTMPHFITCR